MMFSLKLSEFLAGGLPDQDDYGLYIVKSDETLYVGFSGGSVFNRWFAGRSPHIAIGQGGALLGQTLIGQHIVDHLPESFDWTIEILTLGDCVEFCDDEITRLGFRKDLLELQDAEKLMIRKLAPRFNIVGKPNRL
jgi:hypothetical protein